MMGPATATGFRGVRRLPGRQAGPDGSSPHNAFLRTHPLIAALGDPGASLAVPRLSRQSVLKGHPLFFQGDPPAGVYLVEAGGVLLLRANGCGKQVALDWSGPGEACGLADAVAGDAHSQSGRATGASIVWRLATPDLRRWMSERAAFADAVSLYLARRLLGAAEQIESLALERLDARVIRVLRLLAANQASTSGPVSLTLTQEDLAALAGASRQRVHGVLMDLRRRGLVEVGYGRVRVIEPSRL